MKILRPVTVVKERILKFILVSILFMMIASCTSEDKKTVERKELQCQQYKTCGVGENSCERGLTCVVYQTCEKPICIKEKNICDYVCGKMECLLMESYPVQISCR